MIFHDVVSVRSMFLSCPTSPLMLLTLTFPSPSSKHSGKGFYGTYLTPTYLMGGVVKFSDIPHHSGALGRHIDISIRVLK